MSEHKQPLISHFEPPHADLRSYVIGFVSCLVLTLVSFAIVTSHALNNNAALGLVAGLAIIQCVIQLRRFLHLGHEFKPRWKSIVFTAMLTIVLIIVVGSIWIMNNLNYRMMRSPATETEYIKAQDGL